MNPKLSIAYFISSHGFGHAARASAVMNSIFECWPFIHFEIFTQTPEWFFKNSLSMSYAYHLQLTDIGLIQTSPFSFNLYKTIDALDDFIPFDEAILDMLAEKIRQHDCRMIISDISPLGIAVGNQAGISTVLVENFTWDWIYEKYLTTKNRFQKHVDFLESIFSGVDYRIQTEPVCSPKNECICTPPIARSPRSSSDCIRNQLGINSDDQLVLITMGGISETCNFTDNLSSFDKNVYFIVPGISPVLPNNGLKKQNIIFLPHNSSFYHPDLVNASDAVIGKVGYSTLAEVYHAGVPFGYITRSNFRESHILESFVKTNLSAMMIAESEFYNGDWLKKLHDLLALPVCPHKDQNGAGITAKYICNILAKEQEILEIVNSDGFVIGAAPRKQVHGNNLLLHRVVHVLVFDSKERLLLQKRSLSKRVAPGRWDTSVGGHVDCGESVEKAMVREMEEELGICPKTTQFAYQYIHSNDFESELVFTYVCRYDGEIIFNKNEIDAIKFWEPKEIETHFGKGVLSDNFEDEFIRYRTWVESV